MGATRRQRILVAVEPPVLEGALAVLLEDRGEAEIIQFHEVPPRREDARYDVAVVTPEHAGDVEADQVVTLSDQGAGEVVDLLQRRFGVRPPGASPNRQGDVDLGSGTRL